MNLLRPCLGVVGLLLLVACSSSQQSDSGRLSGSPTSGAGGAASSGAGGSTSADGEALLAPPLVLGDPDDGGSEGGAGGAAAEPPPLPEPGQLTAGAWDDNRNFDFFERYKARFVNEQTPGLLPFTGEDFEAAHARSSQPPGPKQRLDIAVVFDTTGSMGDELAYLKSEFSALAGTIASSYPNAAQRWSLVVYRDEGDEYVSKAFPFTADMAAFKKTLSEQSYDGGGDTPEAPEEGLADAAELAWRSDAAVARLAFWVADAPHHDNRAGALADAIEALQQKDVHVYPVASSGVDEFTELTMRSAAQLTLGRYLFLTNDSGIGGDHKEPTLPCYYVTMLDDAILRMVDIEMSGEYREPAAADVIRTGGSPNEQGICKLGSSTEVHAY